MFGQSNTIVSSIERRKQVKSKSMKYKDEIEQFKDEFVSLRGASAEKRQEFDARFKKFIADKTPEEKKELARAFSAAAKEQVEKTESVIEQIDVRLKLQEVLDVASMSYIAERYFKKNRSWFSQRLNNNFVNGVPVSFSQDELKTLSFALNDIGTKMRNTARLIAY